MSRIEEYDANLDKHKADFVVVGSGAAARFRWSTALGVGEIVAHMLKFISPVVAAFAVLLNSTFADEWVTLKDCRLLENPSNDGDSFHVMHNGEEYLFRLYHVDTPESEIDSAVADRVAVQAEHFGLTQEESLRGGEKAKEFTKKALSKPFSVVTRWQKALGRSKLQRYYAIILVDGKNDLAELLIRAGMARAFGQVVADPPKVG